MYLTIQQKVSYFLLAFNALCILIMATYETFAAVYDAVMDDSLYDKWTDFSLRHLPKTKERKKLLELACGTGIQSVHFSQAGFEVTGLDLSADMLKIPQVQKEPAFGQIAHRVARHYRSCGSVDIQYFLQ